MHPSAAAVVTATFMPGLQDGRSNVCWLVPWCWCSDDSSVRELYSIYRVPAPCRWHGVATTKHRLFGDIFYFQLFYSATRREIGRVMYCTDALFFCNINIFIEDRLSMTHRSSAHIFLTQNIKVTICIPSFWFLIQRIQLMETHVLQICQVFSCGHERRYPTDWLLQRIRVLSQSHWEPNNVQ